MNKNIDLTEILEGLEGIELYCPIFGECVLIAIHKNSKFPIMVNTREHINEVVGDTFTKEGLYTKEGHGECLLFPSKEQRDWSKFVRPIKEDTPMMCGSKDSNTWILGFYKYCYNNKHYVKYVSGDNIYPYDYIIPFNKFDPNDIEGSIRDYNIQK